MKMRAILFFLLAAAGCGGDGNGKVGGDGNYAVGSLVFGPNGTTSYVSLLASLGVQTIDYAQAREFGDSADLWVYDGDVFVAEAADFSISRFAVVNGQLVERGKIGFASYGVTEMGFWRNIFISSTKAYFINGATDYIVWNPSTMAITGTVPLPAITVPAGLKAYPGYSDRAAVVRNGKLYQPIYFTDDTFFKYSSDSRIVVLDTATDQPLDVLTVPCPALDSATADDDGNLYFSSWVYGAGAATVLQQPDTCVVELPAGGGAPQVAFTVKDKTGGRQGAAFHYLGHGRALLSVLHGDHATWDDQTPAGDVTFANNWRFWTYDLASGTASELDSFDWHDGGVYTFTIDGKIYNLVSKTDYSSTTIFDFGDGTAPQPLFATKGWSTRLFKVQ
jgi:hypothetical protein